MVQLFKNEHHVITQGQPPINQSHVTLPKHMPLISGPEYPHEATWGIHIKPPLSHPWIILNEHTATPMGIYGKWVGDDPRPMWIHMDSHGYT